MLFSAPRLDGREQDVVALLRSVRRDLGQLLDEPERWALQFRQATLARNIQASNAIEGHRVALGDVAAAVSGREPVGSGGSAWSAVADYRDAMGYILQLTTDPHFAYSGGLLRGLHFLMMKQDLSATPGLYRTGSVFVWSSVAGNRVYDAPPAADVPALMEELAAELNDADDAPTVVRAGMAHLNLAMIHPFRDGNGRLARALQTLVLARERIPWPELLSIEEYLGANTPAYYRALATVGGVRWSPERDTRPWIRFVLTAHHRQATTILRRAREAERLWALLADRCRSDGLDGSAVPILHRAALGWQIDGGGGTDPDLRRLVELGLLRTEGEDHYPVHRPSETLLGIRAEALEPPTPIADPFAS